MTNNPMAPAVLEYNGPAYLIQQHLLEHDYDLSVWDELSDESYVKAVMGSTWFHSLGMAIPDSATDADLFVVMRASRSIHQSDAWMRGDIINWLRDHRYNGGDIPREDLVKFAKELGVASAKRLLNNATTAKAWPISHRWPAQELTYSHHEELNKMDAVTQQAWAERAIAENMSVVALRQAIQEDAVSITVDAGDSALSTTTLVSFASEKIDKKTCIKLLAATIAAEAKNRTNGNVQMAAENVLANYVATGMLRFPGKAWADVFAAGGGKNGYDTSEEEGDA